jgi:hypothetical protein
MKTKYIKGTNKQYSIREDGVVISHYQLVTNQFITNKLIKRIKILKSHLHKDNILRTNIQINGKRGSKMNKSLVADYFKIKGYDQEYRGIKHKDNNPLNCNKNNLYCQNRFKHLTNKDNPLTKKERYKKYRGSKYISKFYICLLIKMDKKDLSDDLYELYKAKLKLKRLIKNKQNEL